jgi:methylmalonyl-CoA mutase C-terminal domain/subunit
MAKVGLDAHDTGALVVSHLLKDEGMEVIYLGIHNTVEGVVRAAQQEDVDVIGLSFLGGEHLYYTKKIMERLKETREEYLVLVGGIIPQNDIPRLKEIGVAEVFGPGSRVEEIARFIRENINGGK